MDGNLEKFCKIWNNLVHGEGNDHHDESSGYLEMGTVDGKQVFDFAESHKHDIDKMLECCRAETENFSRTGIVSAPYYFWRVAVLAKKAKNYELEVKICENYLEQVNFYYRNHKCDPQSPGIIASPRVADMKKRGPSDFSVGR